MILRVVYFNIVGMYNVNVSDNCCCIGKVKGIIMIKKIFIYIVFVIIMFLFVGVFYV